MLHVGVCLLQPVSKSSHMKGLIYILSGAVLYHSHCHNTYQNATHRQADSFTCNWNVAASSEQCKPFPNG